MTILKRFSRRCRNLTLRRRGAERFKEEVEFHLAAQTEDNIRAGMTPEQALRSARLEFGTIAAVREDYRDEETLPFVETLLLDVRYALRVLYKSPGFAITALITLMLGIGTNVVVFGVLNAVLLHPLSVSDPGSLYQIRYRPWMSFRLLTSSYPAFEDLRRRNTTFSGMSAINGYSSAAIQWQNTVRNVSGDEVTSNYFDLLGVQPALGRFFHAADEHGPNSASYVVLSDSLWRSLFGADPRVIGTTVELNKHPFTVIGLAPVQFHGTERFAWPDYWIPIVNQEQLGGRDYLSNRASVAVTVIGRLKPGVTSQQATENLNAIAVQLAREYPATDNGLPLRLIHPGLFGDEGEVIRGFLYSVSVLAFLVLAAACANLASLFAARAVDRSGELALRMALGSSRERLVRQLLTEAMIVALTGGAAGLIGASLMLHLLNSWAPAAHAHLDASVDGRVLMAGLAWTVGSALLFALAPVRQAWQSSPLQAIRSGPANSINLHRFAFRGLLLGAQIAICTLLVSASLVAFRGMLRALHTPLGIQPQGAMLAKVDLDDIAEEGDAAVRREKAIIEAALTIPGVTAAGTVDRTPMTGGLRGTPIFRPGTVEFTLNNSVLAPYMFQMSPGYLQAAGTRLLRGRDFSWHDTSRSGHVAIVNVTFARKMWNKLPAIGQHFVVSGHLTEIVGIVENGKYHDLAESPQPVAYLPSSQSGRSDAVFVIRSQRPVGEMASDLQRTLSSIQPNVQITVQSWSDTLALELLPVQSATVALGVMGLLAAMLAVTGIAGMAAYNVSRRMKEFGIRTALGARKSHVMQAAIGRSMMLLGIGTMLGLLAGIFGNRLLEQVVYQANSRDPLVVGGALLTMILLGIVASAIPAWRAIAVDPSKLMREE